MRPPTRSPLCAYLAFQSTHPLRGATLGVPLDLCVVAISIHAPLTGCDCGLRLPFGKLLYFNPRTPYGVRQRHIYHLPINDKFQSTHPLRGATAKMHKIFCAFCDNRQFYRVSPSGVPSVGALFTYFRGLQRVGAGANLPVNGCALGLRAKASAGARLPSELRKRSLFKSRRSLLAPVRAAVPFQCNSRQQRTESCPNFSA